jgi:hypothetical protein
MGHSRPGASRVVLSLAAATFCGALPLLGQDAATERQGPVWTLEGLRVGQCVRFLMEPGAAVKQLRPGSRLVRADQDPTLHPSLRSVVDGQTEFASWAPASLCLYYSDAIRLGTRRLGSKDPRKGQMLGIWAVAAADQRGSRRDFVLELFGGSRELAHFAQQGGLKVAKARSSRSRLAESGNDRHDVRVGKTRLVWNGRAAGDSTRVSGPLRELWLTKGASGTMWRVQTTVQPTWMRPLVGVLTVEGKDNLAKALKASPTRFVGPLYFGGSAELRFSR